VINWGGYAVASEERKHTSFCELTVLLTFALSGGAGHTNEPERRERPRYLVQSELAERFEYIDDRAEECSRREHTESSVSCMSLAMWGWGLGLRFVVGVGVGCGREVPVSPRSKVKIAGKVGEVRVQLACEYRNYLWEGSVYRQRIWVGVGARGMLRLYSEQTVEGGPV